MAPDTLGVTDEIVVTDQRCAGQAIATVTTGAGFSVLPTVASVLPGTSFALEIEGGSGLVSCEMVDAASGGTVTESDCVYTAGKLEGLDRIEVVDAALSETRSVAITVDLDASLSVWGYERWGLPADQPFVPQIEGGSRVYDLSVVTGPARLEGASVQPTGLGEGEVQIRDRFAGFEVTVPFEVVAARVPPSGWFGRQLGLGEVRAAGDLDGNGVDDVVVALPETNGTAPASGAIAVYAGQGTTLSSTPAWVAFGPGEEAFAGSSLALADVNGDGETDLVVGAPGADDVGVDTGQVSVWFGIPGAWFGSEPNLTVRGLSDGDRAGASVAACDFDGDGFVDLAVGAPGHEESSGVGLDDTGAVFIYRGSATGWPSDPSVIRYGVRPTGVDGAYEPVAGTRLGVRGMAVGDVDGDEQCDLVVASDRDVGGAAGTAGFVALYRGVPTAEGTLSSAPVRVWANDVDPDARFGRALALADVDRDQQLDVLVGAPGWDGAAGSGTGAAFVFLTGDDDGRPPEDPYLPAEAHWWIEGDTAGAQWGASIRGADADADGHADVLIGAPRAGDDAEGEVALFDGASMASATPGTNATGMPPKLSTIGSQPGDAWGQAADLLGDLDADAVADIVVVEGLSDDAGLDVGGVVLAQGASRTVLEVPGEPAGHHHGQSVTWVDTDGDGWADLVIGSPDDGDDRVGVSTGAAHRFAGGATVATGSTRLASTLTDPFDRRGHGLTEVGDVDGDGWADLAVVARTASRPAAFEGPEWANPTACPGLRQGAGAVMVYRGSAAGIGTTPAFVTYGPVAEAGITAVASALDFNGDGVSDLVFSGPAWFGTGGFGIALGRTAVDGQTTVICDAQIWEGLQANDQLGTAVAAVADLDGDGCDELAVGAPGEAAGVPDQGLVRLLFGHGSGCASSERRIVTLGPDIGESAAGTSLASGDVDGDGLADLVVGATGVRVSGTVLGSVWVVPGSYLVSRPPTVLPQPQLPGGANTVVEPIVPGVGRFGLQGPVESGDFGRSVALVDDPGQPGQAALVVGVPQGNVGGVDFAGGVHLYRYDAAIPGLLPVPFMVVAGETAQPGGRLGDALAAGRLGDQTMLAVGAPTSSVQGLQVGAAYVFALP